jgi:TRAP-type C4-dicarboxylate transport system permease small subunit
MKAIADFLSRRAENVAVGMLTALFLTFLLQIFARYVLQTPLGWTVEACLTIWLWLVFWGCAFCLRDEDHIKFDVIYLAVNPKLRRIFALTSALAIIVGIGAALPADYDYITFYKIKKSSILHIRLDYVFSIYGIFAVAVVATYILRLIAILRGKTDNMSQQGENN